MDNAPILNLAIADNRLDQAGYMRRWYPSSPSDGKRERGDVEDLWPQVTSNHLFRWPGVRCVTLNPIYAANSASETADAQWTKTGTSSTYTTAILPGVTTPTIVQQVPEATGCLLTSAFTPENNQPFYADFYLHSVTSESWYADLRFCRNWCLRLLYNGTMQVWTNYAAVGAPEDWQYVDSFRAMNEVRNQHLRVAVYPTAHQELIIWPYNGDPMVLLDAEPLVSQGADGRLYRTICQAAPVRFYVSSGAFYFSYRYMRFDNSTDWEGKQGYLTLPEQALPWDYAGEWTLTGSVGRNRYGYTPTVTPTLLDETGVALTSPPANPFRRFKLKIEMTSNSALFTPELNWAQLRIDPTSQVYTPAAPVTITGGGQLTDISAGAELRGRRDARFVLSDLDGTFTGLWDRLRMCSSITDVTTALTWWKGYTQKTDLPEEQSGDKRVELGTSDMLSRLEIPLSDAYIGDGQVHTAFVEQLFKRAGLAAADYSIAADTLNLTLPEALGQEEPLFQSRDGKTIKEMVEYICKIWSGWDLYADIEGVIHYAPIATTGAAVVTLQGYETAVAGELKYYSLNPSRDEDNFYNVIVVIGADLAGRPLIAFHYDADSVSDPLGANFLGMEKLLVVVDSNLRNMIDVETALGYVVAEHGVPLDEADCECAWHDTLDVGNLVAIGDFPGDSWQIQSLTRLWSPDARLRLRLKKVA